MNRADVLKNYRETQIKTANQGRLVVMLYDGAIRFINQALDGLLEERRKVDRISNDILKAQDIVAELMVSLDFDRGGQIAHNLFSLYMYMNRRLLDANISKETIPLNEVRSLLTELRSAWAEVAERRGVEQAVGGAGGVNLAG